MSPLFYLHGMGGSPADWRWVKELVPGQALATPAAESPEACAALLAEQVPAGAVLCGYSMGGRLAILMAERLVARGKPPRALVLVSTGFGSGSAEERRLRATKDREWAALAESDLGEFWRRWYQQELFSSFLALPAERRESWLQGRTELSPAGQLRHLSPACHGDLRPILQSLCRNGLRTLFVVGALDKKYLALSRELREAEVHVLPGAGHILPLEAPEALASLLRSVL